MSSAQLTRMGEVHTRNGRRDQADAVNTTSEARKSLLTPEVTNNGMQVPAVLLDGAGQ